MSRNQKVKRVRMYISLFPQRIAVAPDRLEQARPAVRLELLAQMPNVDLKHVGVDLAAVAPDALQDLLAAQDLAGVTQKEHEEIVLLGGQFDRMTRPLDFPGRLSEIQQDEVRLILFGGGQTGLAIHGGVHLEPLKREPFLQEGENLQIIVDHQDTGCHTRTSVVYAVSDQQCLDQRLTSSPRSVGATALSYHMARSWGRFRLWDGRPPDREHSSLPRLSSDAGGQQARGGSCPRAQGNGLPGES